MNERETILLDPNNQFTLTDEVLRANRSHGYRQALLIGEQGCGKTTYALLVAFQIYRDWDKVENAYFFTLDDFIKKYDAMLANNIHVPYILWDDAGMHASKYLWMIDRQSQLQVKLLNGIFNSIRTYLSGMVFTSPDTDIIYELRRKSWISGEPEGDEDDLTHRINVYKKKLKGWDPESKPRSRYIGTDLFPMWLPPDVRERYEDRRKVAIKEYYEELKKLMESAKQKAEGGSLSDADIAIYARHRVIVDMTAALGKDTSTIKTGAAAGISQPRAWQMIFNHNNMVKNANACIICTATKGPNRDKEIELTPIKKRGEGGKVVIDNGNDENDELQDE